MNNIKIPLPIIEGHRLTTSTEPQIPSYERGMAGETNNPCVLNEPQFTSGAVPTEADDNKMHGRIVAMVEGLLAPRKITVSITRGIIIVPYNPRSKVDMQQN